MANLTHGPLSLDTHEFQSRFGDVQLVSTGSLIRDMADIWNCLTFIHAELQSGEPWRFLSKEDPMLTIRILAAHVELLSAHLREQGFRPPTVDYAANPLAFVAENAQFIASIYPLVVEPIITVH